MHDRDDLYSERTHGGECETHLFKHCSMDMLKNKPSSLYAMAVLLKPVKFELYSSQPENPYSALFSLLTVRLNNVDLSVLMRSVDTSLNARFSYPHCTYLDHTMTFHRATNSLKTLC